LSINELLLLKSEVRSKEKNLAVAYLMLLGGHLGVHRFYLKRNWTGIFQLCLFLIASAGYVLFSIISIMEVNEFLLISIFILLVALPGIALFVWIIIDLFLIPKMIKQWNERLEEDLMQEIVALRETK
jgi:TM2 domain-containing membrane protein YozV